LKTIDSQYLAIAEEILNYGEDHADRTGVGTKSLFGVTIRHDLSTGFPLLTTKFVSFKSALHETLWMFIQGSSDCTYLKNNNVTIWNEWAVVNNDTNSNGTIGNLYGPILRSYRVDKNDPTQVIDQLQNCIDMIKNTPNSRRIVMTAFDPRFAAKENLTFEENVAAGNGVLNPCHSNFIQFKVTGDGKLNAYFLTRSNDWLLGAPFNLAAAGFLVHMIAHVCDLEPGMLVYNAVDAHIYNNHQDSIRLQLPRQEYASPRLLINRKVTDINEFTFEDFELVDYNYHPAIKAPVAI
jgi:thymidylate synthase